MYAPFSVGTAGPNRLKVLDKTTIDQLKKNVKKKPKKINARNVHPQNILNLIKPKRKGLQGGEAP